MSTLFVNNLNTASGTTITVPTGKKLVVTDGGGLRVPGTVIQTLHGNMNAVNVSSTTMADIGTLSITPKYNNSKILVTFLTHIYVTENASDAWRGTNIRLLRDSTVIYGDGTSEYGHGRYERDDQNRYMAYQTRQFLDSPSTASAITYKVQANSIAGLVNCLFNNASYGSGGNMTLMEIAQ